jgi:hypothetical protein
MASRNRTSGHNLERDCVKILKPIYPNAVTSRAESRNRDDQKVDLCYTGHLNVQCKNYSKILKYTDILDEMPKEEGQMNIIIDRQTRKSPNGRFMKVGEYVHMHLEDFIKIMKKYEGIIDTDVTDTTKNSVTVI